MSIIRLIHIQLDPSENEKAERVWKDKRAPLMIRQQGLHLREAAAVQGGRRVHLVFGMGNPNRTLSDT